MANNPVGLYEVLKNVPQGQIVALKKMMERAKKVRWLAERVVELHPTNAATMVDITIREIEGGARQQFVLSMDELERLLNAVEREGA